jgi:hypothetical protein
MTAAGDTDTKLFEAKHEIAEKSIVVARVLLTFDNNGEGHKYLQRSCWNFQAWR